jgi:SAM-dependent methyltransferase
MENTFSKIYQKNIWGNGSGLGSTLNYNSAYIDFLQNLMKDTDTKTVLDIGCGDWQFSQYIDWSKVYYTGIDCVKSVIDRNHEKYRQDNVRFLHIDPTVNFEHIPKKFDLVILKDILQHWDNDAIIKFMDRLTKEGNHKNILIVNNFKNAEGENRNVDNRYHYAKLDALKYPLNMYNPKVLGYYKFKQVALIDNSVQGGTTKKSKRQIKKNRKSYKNSNN